MIIGINIDDKEVKKYNDYYKDFLRNILKYYPFISFVELTYLSFNWAEPYNAKLAKETSSILKDFPFFYSIHFPEALSYLIKKRYVIKQFLEFSQMINNKWIVIHSIKESISPLKFNSSLYSNKKKLNHINSLQMQKEYDYVNMFLEEISDDSVSIYIENSLIKPEQSTYSYSSNPLNLAKQIEKFKGKKVYICLDWGHAYLSSKYLNINFDELITSIFPFVKHMHMHNNYGFKCKSNDCIKHNHPNGDYHLPIYEGAINFNNFSSLLQNYKDSVALEYTFCNCGDIQEAINKSLSYLNSLHYHEDV